MKSAKLWLGGMAVLILAGVVFGPVVSNLQLRLKTQKQLKQELRVLESKLSVLEGIDRELISQRVVKMEAVFPSEKPVVSLLSSLSQLAQKYNLSFGGISLRPGSLTVEESQSKAKKTDLLAGLYDLEFGFEVSGDFASILNFLKNLENVAPLMKIDQVGLTIKSNPLFTSQQTLVVANINVGAFYQPPPKSLGKISQPVALLSKQDEIVLNRLFSFEQLVGVLPMMPTGKVNLFE